MRTQVMHELATGTPWLERELPDGLVEKTILQALPFTIGRSDTADLQVDSNQVSREHAVISRQGKKIRVRDLGSTNGTFLNGEKIEEATLGDGDLLVVADVELVFFSGAASATRETATQVMPPSHAASDSADWDTVLAVRRIQEAVTQRSIRTLFQPIVQLSQSTALGYEAFASRTGSDAAQTRCESLTGAIECRATDRLRDLFRRVAAEEAAGLPQGDRLFVAVTAAEVARLPFLDHLCQLRDLMGATRQLVIEIPDSAVRNSPDYSELLSRLREAQIEVAYDGYAAGKTQILDRKDVTPDFLKLAPSMFRSIHRGADRQRQVELLVRAAHDMGCVVVATGIDNETDLEVCRDLGCTLAQGELFGKPQSVARLIQASARASSGGNQRGHASHVAAAKIR